MIDVVLWTIAIVVAPLVLHCLVLTYKAIWDTYRMWYNEYKRNAKWRAYEKRQKDIIRSKLREKDGMA